METNTFTGYYGSGKTQCNIYTCTTREGGTWYAIEDSINVNFTWQELFDGVDVENDLVDDDFFTASVPIDSEETLAEQVEL